MPKNDPTPPMTPLDELLREAETDLADFEKGAVHLIAGILRGTPGAAGLYEKLLATMDRQRRFIAIVKRQRAEVEELRVKHGSAMIECTRSLKEIDALRAEVERLKAHFDVCDSSKLVSMKQMGDRLHIENQKLRAQLAEAKRLVDEQSEDERLWQPFRSIDRHPAQHALRRLHEVIEGKTLEACALEILEKHKERP